MPINSDGGWDGPIPERGTPEHAEFKKLSPEARHVAKYTAKNKGVATVKGEAAKAELGIEAPHPASYGQAIEASADALDSVANNSDDPGAADVFKHTTKVRASLDAHDEARINEDHDVAAGHLKNAADSMSHALKAWHKVSPFANGPEEAIKHIKNIAQNYKVQAAGGAFTQVKQARPDGTLSKIATNMLKEKAQANKGWNAENNRQKKALPPNVQRVTPEQQESERQSSRILGRQMNEAAPRDESGRRVPTAKELRETSTKMMGSPEAYESSPVPVGEGAKYLGKFGRFGPSGTPGIPKINREIFKAHAQDAVDAMARQKPVARETKEALGRMGMEAVKKHVRSLEFGKGQEK